MQDVGKHPLEMLQDDGTAENYLTIMLENKPIKDVMPDTPTIPQPEVVNSFSIIQSTPQNTQRKCFPDPYKHPKNGKEELHNKTILVLERCWKCSIQGSYRKDGRHELENIEGIVVGFQQILPKLSWLGVYRKLLHIYKTTLYVVHAVASREWATRFFGVISLSLST